MNNETKRQQYHEQKLRSSAEAMPESGGGGCHSHLQTCANHSVKAGYDKDQFISFIRPYVHGTRPVSNKEIIDAYQKAAIDLQPATTLKPGYIPQQIEKQPEPNLTADSNSLQPATENDIKFSSPATPPDKPQDMTRAFLEAMYRPDDNIFIGTKFDKGEPGVTTKKEKEWLADRPKAPFYIVNPLTGRQALTGSEKSSYRCDNAVADHRYLVVEFDETTPEKQLALCLRLIDSGCVAAITHSGNKSYHVILKIDAEDAEQFRLVRDRIKPYLVAIGADRACFNPARLTRLPGAIRDNGKLQKLIYLNPGARGGVDGLEDLLKGLCEPQRETTTPAAAAEDTHHYLPPAPIEVFPYPVQMLITRAVETFGTTIEVVISALIAISGGLIGRRRLLQIKSDWAVHAALYWLIVALTGDSKSPVISWLMNPVEAIERQLLDRYKAELQLYEAALDARSKGDDIPKKPTRQQVKVGDVTIEKKADILEANPGGIIEYRDEASGFIADEDKYHGAKGSDRSKHLEIYDRRPLQVDRKSAPPVYVPEPSLARFGGIQPKVLRNCFSDQDAAAGSLGRFACIHSRQTKPSFWTEQTMKAEDGFLWDNLVNKFFNYEMPENEHGWRYGLKIEVTPQAKGLYIEYFNELSALPYVDGSAIREILPKSREHCLRLCLILHCIEHATAGTDETAPVTADTMRKAIILARWVYAHNVKTWLMVVDQINAPDRQPLEKRIAQAIIDMESKIIAATLSTSEITEKVNSGYPEQFQSSPDSIGRICSNKLKLAKNNDTSNRGWVVTPDTIERLKTDFNLSASALSDLSDCVEPLIKADSLPEKPALKALTSLSTYKNQKTAPPPIRRVCNSEFEDF